MPAGADARSAVSSAHGRDDSKSAISGAGHDARSHVSSARGGDARSTVSGSEHDGKGGDKDGEGKKKKHGREEEKKEVEPVVREFQVLDPNPAAAANTKSQFAPNSVSTAKYSFMPLMPDFIVWRNLWEQFHRYANLYFLLISFLQLIPGLSPTGRFTTLVPLIMVLTVTMVKDFFEDVQRHRSDRELNGRATRAWRDGQWVELEWKDLRVGEVCLVNKNETFPADLILIWSSLSEGMGYIETSSLDGETNLKIRKAPAALFKLFNASQPDSAQGKVVCETPNERLYNFEGYFQGKGRPDKIPITADNILLRGAELRNTPDAIGIVVFTGADSKLMRNSSGKASKMSRVDHVTNKQIMYVFAVLLVLCFGSTVGAVIFRNRVRKSWYLTTGVETSVLESNMALFAVSSFGTFLILFNNLIPISLYVSLEMVKIFIAYVINNDLNMYHDDTDTAALTRSSSLVEELGQIEYIFSDKTGTLTCNMMDFLKFTVVHVEAFNRKQSVHAYGTGTTEIGRAAAVREGREVADDRPPGWSAGPDGFQFYDPRINDFQWCKQQNAEELEFFLVFLAVCHDVIPEVDQDTGAIVYQAASPDESCLVKSAKSLGVVFCGRSDDSVTVHVCGVPHTWEVLQMIEFNSTRKRMSVIVRSPKGRLMILCKGADSVMYDRLKKTDPAKVAAQSQTMDLITQYAAEGLRTLVLAKAELDEYEFRAWHKRYHDASTSLADRSGKMMMVAEEIEMDLELVGTTAIEDKLQLGVPSTIELLSKAGIKIWVLTGDKQETAINIGFACSLLNDEMGIFIFDDCLAKDMELLTSAGWVDYEAAKALWQQGKFHDGSVSVAGYDSGRGCIQYETPFNFIDKPAGVRLAASRDKVYECNNGSNSSCSLRVTGGHTLLLRQGAKEKDDKKVPVRATVDDVRKQQQKRNNNNNNSNNKMTFVTHAANGHAGQRLGEVLPLGNLATVRDLIPNYYSKNENTIDDDVSSDFAWLCGLWLARGGISITKKDEARYDVAITFPQQQEEEEGGSIATEERLKAIGIHFFTTNEDNNNNKNYSRFCCCVRDRTWVEFFLSEYAATCRNGLEAAEAVGGIALRRRAEEAYVREHGADADVGGDDLLSTNANKKWAAPWMMQIDQSCSAVLINGLSSGSNTNRIYTTSERLRDQCIVLALHAGYSAHYDRCQQEQQKCWCISYSRVSAAAESPEMIMKEVTNYRDGVWCVSTPSSNIVVRRKQHRSADNSSESSSSSSSHCPAIIGNCNKSNVFTVMQCYVDDARSSEEQDLGLVIQGDMLEAVLGAKNRREPEVFLSLATHCRAVICCRVSPLQKAQVVKLVRDNIDTVTLAIGDGANDVSMIQAAHVGVGISGLEGLQAARASDFSIAQFRFLQRLLLVHGRYSYRRISKVTLFSFYKNILLYLTQFWFASMNLWTGQSLYDAWALSLWNMSFSAFPIIFLGVLDRDVEPSMLLSTSMFPELYQDGLRSQIFNTLTFWMYQTNALLQSVAIFILCAYIWDFMMSKDGMFFGLPGAGVTTYTCAVFLATIKVALEIQSWTVANVISLLYSVLSWYVFLCVYGFMFGWFKFSDFSMWFGVPITVLEEPVYYFTVMLVVTICLVREFAWKLWRHYFQQKLVHIVQEQGQLLAKMPDKQFSRKTVIRLNKDLLPKFDALRPYDPVKGSGDSDAIGEADVNMNVITSVSKKALSEAKEALLGSNSRFKPPKQSKKGKRDQRAPNANNPAFAKPGQLNVRNVVADDILL